MKMTTTKMIIIQLNLLKTDIKIKMKGVTKLYLYK